MASSATSSSVMKSFSLLRLHLTAKTTGFFLSLLRQHLVMQKSHENPKTRKFDDCSFLRGEIIFDFCPQGVKINKDVYRQEILDAGLIPWTDQRYPDGDWTFQQDRATSHTANVTQLWCKDHCPLFVSKKNGLQVHQTSMPLTIVCGQSQRPKPALPLVFRHFNAKTGESMG